MNFPHDLDAEKFCLGQIIVNPDVWIQVHPLLGPADFFVERHRRIFRVMMELFAIGDPVDRITIAEKLSRTGQLESVGGMTYIVSLDESMPVLPNIEAWIRIIKEKATLRKTILMADKIKQRAMAGDGSADIIASSLSEINSIRESMPKSQYLSVEQILGVAGGIDKLFSMESVHGLQTPWYRLNNMLYGGGFQAGQFIIVAGIQGGGKTAFAVGMANQVIASGRRVAFASLEMTAVQIFRRMLAVMVPLNQKRIVAEGLTRQEREAVAAGIYTLAGESGNLLSVWQDPRASVDALRAGTLKESKVEPISLLVVDYLQLMDEGEQREGTNRAQRLGEISRGLKILAKELNCPVIALSQLKRVEETREPRISDLRDSSSLESDADVVIFPYSRPGYDLATSGEWVRFPRPYGSPWDVKLIVAKQRDGETGFVPLRFESQFTRFVEIEE